MDSSGSQGRTVKLRADTLARINRLKHRGQSYDGVINELLDLHDSKASGQRNQYLETGGKGHKVKRGASRH